MTGKDVAVKDWRQTLDTSMEGISNLLPRQISPDRFRTVAANAIANNRDLLTMMRKPEEARTVINALVACATDGLLPDGREAALVTFGGRQGRSLVYVPMIKGVLKRLRQSGEVRTVRSHVVYEEDHFEVIYGDEEKIVHVPAMHDRGHALGCYAIIVMSDGEAFREWMPAEEVQKVRAVSRSSKGPWSGPFEHEMWRKTVIKRAAKYCPLSSELMNMLDRDNDLYDMDAVEAPAKTLYERFQDRDEGAPEPAPDDEAGVIDGEATEVEDAPEGAPEPAGDGSLDLGDLPDDPQEDEPEPKPAPSEVAKKLCQVLAQSPHMTAFEASIHQAIDDGRMAIIEEDEEVLVTFNEWTKRARAKLQPKEGK